MKMNINSKKGDSRKTPAEVRISPGRISASIKQKVPWTQPLRRTGSPDNTSKSLLKRIVPSKVSIGKTDRQKSPKRSIYGPKRRSPVNQQQIKDQTLQTIHKCPKDTLSKNGSHQRENGKSSSSHSRNANHEPSSSPIIVDPKLIKNVLESKVNYSTQKSSNTPGDNNNDADEMPKLMICPQPLDLESLTNSPNSELGVTKPMGCMYEITVEERGGKLASEGENGCGKTSTTMPGNVILLSSPEDADPASGAVRYIPAAILLMDPREYSEGLTSEEGRAIGLQAAMALQSEQSRVISDMLNNTTSHDTNIPTKRHDNSTESKENIVPLMIRRSEEDRESTQPNMNGECLASEHRRSNESQNIKERNNESTASSGNKNLERTHKDDISTQISQVPTFHNILPEISDSSKSYVEDQSAVPSPLCRRQTDSSKSYAGDQSAVPSPLYRRQTDSSRSYVEDQPSVPSPPYRRQNSLQFKQGNYTETENLDIIQQCVNKRDYREFRFENGETCNSSEPVNGKERTSGTELKTTSNDQSRDQCFSNVEEETQREKNDFMELGKPDEGELNLEANPSMNPQSDFESELSTSNISSTRFQPSDMETDDQNSSGAFSANLEGTKSPFEIHLPEKSGVNDLENSERIPVTCHFERLSRIRSREKNRERKRGKQNLNSNKQTYAPNMPTYGTKITEITSEDRRMSKPPLHCSYINNNNKNESPRKTDMSIPVYHMAQIIQKASFSKPATEGLNSKLGDEVQETPQRRLNILDLRTASSDNVITKSSSEQTEKLDRKQIGREPRLPARPKYEGSPPISCPDSRCGLMLSSLTMLPHFNKEHAQVPFVLVHAGRNISISVNLSDMPPYSPKIFAFFHVIEKMSAGPFVLMVATMVDKTSPHEPSTSLVAWLNEMEQTSHCTIRVLRRTDQEGAVNTAVSYTGPTVSLRHSQGLRGVLRSGRFALANPWLLRSMEKPGTRCVEVTAVVHKDA